MPNDETGVSSLLAGIQKLKGVVNYQDWKFQVQNYLEHRSLWSAVNPAISTAGVDETVTADKDRRVRTFICMLLEPICFAKVRTTTTAWTKLKEAYEDKGWGRKLRLQQSLWSCKLETFSSMDNYVTKVMDLSQQLEDVDVKVGDEWKIWILLGGLPESYEPFLMSLFNLKDCR
jgi:hypothetical protein